MDLFPFMVAKATLLFLAAVLMVEYSIRRRELSKEFARNRQKQQQLFRGWSLTAASHKNHRGRRHSAARLIFGDRAMFDMTAREYYISGFGSTQTDGSEEATK